MFPVLIITELHLVDPHKSSHRKFVKKAINPMKSKGTVLGTSLWQSTDDLSTMLAMILLPSEDQVSTFITEMSKVVIEIGTSALSQPADVKPIRVIKSSGLRPYEAADNSIASVSLRVSDPGAAQDLMDDYDIVFNELTPIKGLRGWLYGQTLNLDEEVFGIAIWDDEASLATSIPLRSSYQVTAFRKVSSD